MKKVQNLIKNKDLINIFKRSKFRNYLNKKKVKNIFNFFIKFKKILKNLIGFNLFYKNIFFLNKCILKQKQKQKQIDLIKLSIFLINIVYIKTFKPITNTLRFKKSMFLIKFKKIFKSFKFFTKNNAGRNNSGIITLYSKGSKKRKNIVIFNSNIWDKYLYTVISFFRNKKKIISLCKHTTGSLSTVPNISGVNINQNIFSTILPKKYWINNLPGNYVLLKFLDKFCIFSNIQKNGFFKIALSSGTFSQLIDFFKDFNLVKISLPSKKCIFVSGSCFVLLGKNSQQQRKFCFLGKAGLNKNVGIKPKVRGVARNPVDHPHGGRTKTNKPEVSIWGWIAKRNK